MESLSDTHWDVVISGTGLHQSLLALALSRSGKNILHVDENVFYGDAEAAFSIDEVDEWATRNSSASPDSLFAQAEVVSKDVDQLASSRSYSIALAPQMIHAGSTLLSQLVASKAYRQIEFLAVGSFYIFQVPNDPSSDLPSLSRVPSTREDVFANTAIPARSKRFLMKFLKFVLEYDAEPQTDVWKPRAEEPLVDFLGSEFKLDALLQSYVTTLTLSLDGNVSVKDGLAAIHRHMTSMGRFGTGFAAVYPKWGGLSEVAQVGCRAAAVGGAIYMLGTGIHSVKTSTESGDVEIALSNDMAVKTKSLVQTQDLQKLSSSKLSLSRLTAVVKFNSSTLFESVVEGAPAPAVAIVGFPPGSVSDSSGDAFKYPVYAMVHSSDTGECPVGQCVVYLSTITTPNAATILSQALKGLVSALAADQETPKPIFELQYQQKGVVSAASVVDGQVIHLPPASLDLAFDDSIMVNVEEAWNALTKDDEKPEGTEYMKFTDREGADVDDDEF